MTLTVTLVGGPTAILELAGLRILTDPTFDEPQSYPQPLVNDLVKTAGPALTAEQVGRIDVVLASHEHDDNLDHSGREFLGNAEKAYTTAVVAGQFSDNVIALTEYESVTVPLPAGGGELTITGVPAHHGPEGIYQLLGPVLGFVLSGEGLPTVYISGDNSSLEVIREVQDKVGPIDIAVLFTGAPSFEMLADGAFITLSNETALEAAQMILTDAVIVPIHTDSWGHFTQNTSQIQEVFDQAGLADRLVALHPGESATIPSVHRQPKRTRPSKAPMPG